LAVSITAPLLAQEAPSTRRLDRLRALAELDGAVHYFHPASTLNPALWDSLFADHASRIADAPTEDAYRGAVRQLIAQLGDPATRVAGGSPSSWTTERLPHGVLLVRPATAQVRSALFERETATARMLVVDLRGGTELPEPYLARLLFPRPASAAAQRTLHYEGLPYPEFNVRRAYYRAWETVPGDHFEGGEGRAVAFLVDGESVLPPFALALRTTGRGAVIGIGTARVRPSAETYRVHMGEGVSVDVRVGQRMVDTSDVGLPVDTSVFDTGDAVAAATSWADRPVRPWPEATQDTLAVVAVPLAPTSGPWSAIYPPNGYRLLAAARLWNTMRLFFPYKAEMGEDWDAAFRAGLSAIENAPDSLAYVKSIAALTSHLHDSHARVWNSKALSRYFFGEVYPPVIVQFVEGQLAVVRILDREASRSGLAVGDIITSIDGETTAARVRRLAPFISASTPQALQARIASFILAASDSTAARLTVRSPEGPERMVRVPRSSARPFRPYGPVSREGPIIRVLPGNIGYVDLERITDAMVDSVFAVLKGTKGIVFDARGYPETAAWVQIARRLSSRPDSTMVARFETLVVTSPDTARTSVRPYLQRVAPANGPSYSGRTALLIDERAISQTEHLGLVFEAENGPLFVGSPTTGADGAFDFLQLPGAIRISFSGARVRHANGRPLQRVGLQPDIPVAPTLTGIRSGRDEVLERAVSCLASDYCSKVRTP